MAKICFLMIPRSLSPFANLQGEFSVHFFVCTPTYISNLDGGLNTDHPENAVHYRRLPHQSEALEDSKQLNMIKDIWVSTMDCVYQDEYNPHIGHKCQTVELEDGDGFYEGRDAEEVWMGGELIFYGGDKTWPGQKGFRPWRYPVYEKTRSGRGL